MQGRDIINQVFGKHLMERERGPYFTELLDWVSSLDGLIVKSLYFLAGAIYFFFHRNLLLDRKRADIESEYEKTNVRMRSLRYTFCL